MPFEPVDTTSQAYTESGGGALIFPSPQGYDDAGHKGDMIFPALSGTWPASQRDIISMQPYDAGAPTLRILSQVEDSTAELGDIGLSNTIVIGQNVWQYFHPQGSIMWGQNGVGPIARLTASSGYALWKFDQTVTGSGTIGIWDRSVSGTGVDMRISAQNSMPNVDASGGRLILAGGERGVTTRARGGVAIQMNGLGDDVEIEAVDVGTAHRIVAFCGGASYAAANAGSAPGDRVLHVMPAAVAPSAPPAVGAFLYVDPSDGKLKAWNAGSNAPNALTP